MTRRLAAAAAVAAALLVGACGGGGTSSTTPTTSAPPGAKIDPNANGTFTGPINKAKSTVTQLNQQQNQLNGSDGG